MIATTVAMYLMAHPRRKGNKYPMAVPISVGVRNFKGADAENDSPNG